MTGESLKLILVDDFAFKYNITTEQIKTYRFKNKKPFIKRGIYYYIDEDYFKRRKNFELKIWNDAHNLFYFLSKKMQSDEIAEMMTLLELGYICEKRVNLWNTYLSTRIFMRLEESVLQYKISKMLWRFWRNAKWAVQMMFKKCKVKKENRKLERIWG